MSGSSTSRHKVGTDTTDGGGEPVQAAGRLRAVELRRVESGFERSPGIGNLNESKGTRRPGKTGTLLSRQDFPAKKPKGPSAAEAVH